MDAMMDTDLKFHTGYRISLGTGVLEDNHPERMSTLHFYHAFRGDRIQLLDTDYKFAVAIYDLTYDDRYIYTYSYQPEESWTTYREDMTDDSYQSEDFEFTEEVYFRIIMKQVDDKNIDIAEGENAGRIIKWLKTANIRNNTIQSSNKYEKFAETHAINEMESNFEINDVFSQEIESTVNETNNCKDNDTLSFILLSDSHYVVNGTWQDTHKNISAVSSRITPGGIIHLGDCTDGMVHGSVTADYVRNVQEDLKCSGLPIYYTIGNHDSNYFKNNKDLFSNKDICNIYLKDQPQNVYRQKDKLYYYADFQKQQIRCIFLESFDYRENVRYGFSEEELDWLEELLAYTSYGYDIIVFSHVPPVPRLHYWSNEIRGSRRLIRILRYFHNNHGTSGKILAFIHGHNHADQVDLAEGFPIVSIGCNKCEYFTDKKPEGAVTPERNIGTVSQDLWDILVISKKNKCLDLIRFGAGENRHVSIEDTCGVAEKESTNKKAENENIYNKIETESTYEKARMQGTYEKPGIGAYMKKVITYGTFDLFHEGHYNLLKRAKELGDYLIVGVTTEHYDEERGKINVVDSLLDRIDNVRKTGFADEIVIEDHEGQKLEDIQKLDIDIFTVGSDWIGAFDYLNEFCKVVYLDRTPDISSTMLRKSKFPIVRLGVVGTGRIAPRFISEAKYVSGINIRCAYNPHEESAKQFQDKYEIDCMSGEFTDFLDKIDAIYIASPHETHYFYAKIALEHGKHVLCEKPLAFTKTEAEGLFVIAENHHVILMEGIKTAYCPGFSQMINVAKSGKIGEIRDVEACFSRITSPHLREMTDVEYGGAFLEFGSYTLLPIIKLLGTNYKEVFIDSIVAENGVDLYSKIHFTYDSGLAMSKTGLGVKSEGQLVIAGTKGYILASSPWWLTKKFEIHYEDPNKIERYAPKFLGDGLRYEISEFVSKVNAHGGRTFKLTREESVAMADIVERFMAKRKNDKEKLHQRNINAGVKIWAHRGCSYEYPENTLPAFKAACELPGITGIELDIQLTRDGQIVVFHDEMVDRVTNESGNVKDFTLEELKKLRFWNSGRKEYAQDVSIPTMEEVLQLVKPFSEKNGIKINIELKNSKVSYENMEEKILKLVNEYGMKDFIIYSSFNENSLKLLKQLDNAVLTGVLAYEFEKCIAFASENQVDAYHPNIDTINDQSILSKNAVVRAWNGREAFFINKETYSVFDLEKVKKVGVTDWITNLPEKYL